MESFMVQTRRNFMDYIEAFSKYDFPFQENLFLVRNATLRTLWQEKAFSTFYMFKSLFIQDVLYNSMFKKAVNVYYNTDTLLTYVSDTSYKDVSTLDKLWNMDWNFEAYFLYQSRHMNSTDIKKMITSWTAQVGYPMLQVKKRHTDDTQITMSVINCFNVDHKKPCEQNWWIPMTINKIQNTEVTEIIRTILNYPDMKFDFILRVNETEFVIVVDSPGYRVNYDRQSWKHIAFFLQNGGRKTARWSDVTLAQILDDAFYFLVQNTEYNEYIHPESNIRYLYIYIEVASSIFHANNSYTAWYPIFNALENMSKIFPFPESVFSKYIKHKLLEILSRFLDDISRTQPLKNKVSSQLYYEVLKWTCILGNSKCKYHVNEILEWHFKYPAQNKLLPSWQKWIYCQRLKLETVTYSMSASWQKIFNIYQTQRKEEEVFEFLPCSKQYKNLRGFLFSLQNNFLPIPKSRLRAKRSASSVLCNIFKNLLSLYFFKCSLLAKKSDTENIVKTKESITVTLLFNIFALHSKNHSALEIILLELEENRIGRDVNILAMINCIINNIYSDDGLAMINQVFLDKLKHIHKMNLFAVDAIREKINIRRSFLIKMQNAILYKPQILFNYKHIND